MPFTCVYPPNSRPVFNFQITLTVSNSPISVQILTTFTKKSSFQNAANALFLNIFEIRPFVEVFVTIFLTNISQISGEKVLFVPLSTVSGGPSVDVLKPPKGCQRRQQNSYLTKCVRLRKCNTDYIYGCRSAHGRKYCLNGTQFACFRVSLLHVCAKIRNHPFKAFRLRSLRVCRPMVWTIFGKT